jgi:NADH-quinone oxidoreductase subunit N
MDGIVFKSFIPEIFLSISILLQLVFNARLINNINFNFPLIDKEVLGQFFFILCCLFFLLLNLKIQGFSPNYLFLNDEGGRVVKLFLLAFCLLSLVIISNGFVLQNLNFFEFFNIFLLSILSLLLLVNSYDLISTYLIIEMQALCFYILSSFRRNSSFSTEAGLKYFVSGSFISGFFLFGCSLIYGALGTLNLNNIELLLAFDLKESSSFLYFFVLIGILFITITLLFKISAAPFHFWSPDVYEGSPLSATIIFSIIPKLSLFTFFVKWLSSISILFLDIKFVLISIGIFSVFLGTFFAIRQKRLKRLVIYSSIAQVGFLVAILGVQTIDGYASLYFFLIIYMISSVLIWSNITLFYDSQNLFNIFYKKAALPLFLSGLSNLFKTNKMWAFSFVLIFFSIAGVPPLSGFLSKIFILFGLIQSQEIIGSLFLILISAISVYYYLRVIKIIYFESKDVRSQNKQFQTVFQIYNLDIICFIIAFCLFCLVFFFFHPTNLILCCQHIVLNLFSF